MSAPLTLPSFTRLFLRRRDVSTPHERGDECKAKPLRRTGCACAIVGASFCLSCFVHSCPRRTYKDETYRRLASMVVRFTVGVWNFELAIRPRIPLRAMRFQSSIVPHRHSPSLRHHSPSS
ncbi:hypothetical protein SCHPADRAFT_948196 [Schizopora paradoxa]|uniref:Uncharacterized protein n=1 Tax=Schizopora paradoxa TaxID=27342 RepID=A0A0H2QX71_9AGAM|nr:hypothetical protein SCHPADRAFT_948196 [Schizopora paradoxa]